MPRILVIKPSSLGDIVHALQVMQAISRAVPSLEVDWVVRDRFAGLVEAAPFVRRILVFRRKEGWRALRATRAELKAGQWDLVFDMQGLFRSGCMASAANAARKWGRRDSREFAGLFYTHKVALPAGEGPWHAIDVLRPFAAALGTEVEVRPPLELRAAEQFEWAGFFDARTDNNFVIFTDSRAPKRVWPHFEGLTQLILERLPQARVAWCAGVRQEPGFGAVAEARFLNLTGCPFAEMMALARWPSIFVGNDTGPMHLSAAVGNKVLAIFGPSPARRFGPYPLDDPRHRVVTAPGGKLAELSAVKVFEELLTLRGGNPNPTGGPGAGAALRLA